MMQGPGVVVPLVCTLVPNVLLQSPQSVSIEFSIHCFSWWNKFLIHDAFSVKKQTKIELKLLQTCHAFFGHSKAGVFY